MFKGGFDGNQCTQSCEVYDVEKDEWSMIANMLHPRSGHKFVLFKNEMFALGGYDGLSRLDLCEKYDPDTNTWSRIRSMNIPRTNFGVAIIDGKIFVAGGYSNNYATSSTERYQHNENKWQALIILSEYRNIHFIVLFILYRYLAPGMCQERFAFTLSKVSGLPNVEDFVLRRPT